MQKLIYPTKKMNISQSYDGKVSHYDEMIGKPMAYAIDENCGDKGRDYFYAPCDLVVKRVYGINGNGTNTIWLESKEKVKLANGNSSFVTIRVTHPNDDTLSPFKVGQVYKQFDKLFKEGNDGYATGYHFHIEVNTCKFEKLDSNGWIKNNKGAWVTSPNSIKPEEAFFVDLNFTKIISTNKLKFKTINYFPGNNSLGNNLGNISQDKIKYFPKCNKSYKSIVEALNSINVPSSFTYRFKIATKNKIKLYIGSSKQNTQLLELLKNGKLIIP